MRKLIAAVGACLAAVSIAACGHDNFKDVKNVPNAKPDYILNYENMDKHPNIGFLCIHGVPILTTTRSYNALTIVPTQATDAWNFCKAHEK